MNNLNAILVFLFLGFLISCGNPNSNKNQYEYAKVKNTSSPDSASLQMLDYNYGFNKIKLETPKRSFTDLILVSTNEFNADGINNSKNLISTEIFIKDDDIKLLGNLKIDSIFYEFYKERLYKIRVEFEDNNGLVLNSLKDLYGEPVNETEELKSKFGAAVPDKPYTNYFWDSEKVNLRLEVFNLVLVPKDRKLDSESSLGKYVVHRTSDIKPLVVSYISKKIEQQITLDSDSIYNYEKSKLIKGL